MARPPSARAHQRVLDAALELFAERGVDAASMDAISEASGVSKATVYKHFSDKAALCLQALVRAHGVDDLPAFDSGNLRRDLLDFLQYRSPDQDSEMFRRLMPHFMAYASRNPDFREAWKVRVMEPPRMRLRQILERALKRGDLPAGFNLEVGIALLLGPMMYRRFAALAVSVHMPADLPATVVDTFLKAHAIRHGRAASLMQKAALGARTPRPTPRPRSGGKGDLQNPVRRP